MERRLRGMIVRSIASVAAGATVAVIAYLVAYRALHDASGFRMGELSVRARLNGLEMAIEDHRKAAGHLPERLSELAVAGEERIEPSEVEAWLRDSWGRPFQYRVDDDRFDLYSLGRDGRPGGEGIDADIYPTSANRPFPPPTFRQFVFELPTEGIRNTCLAAGVFTALVCLVAPRRPEAGWGHGIVAVGAATAFGAILVAIHLSALHVPSGH